MPDYPNSAQIISKRRHRQRSGRNRPSFGIKRSGVALLAIFSLLLVAGILVSALYYASIAADLPSIEILPQLLGEDGTFRQPTRLYDRTGEHLLVTLENPNAAPAKYQFLELIPKEVINATLAVRDPDFWQHPGFQRQSDNPGLAEELVLDFLLYDEEESIQRIWRTRLLAAQITWEYGRETILEWYLNNAAFGQLAYGVDEAAWVYFDKSARDLNLAEAALLGAVVDSPALNPIDAPEVARQRQSQVLADMLALGLLNQDQALSANAQPILVLTTALPLQMTASDFTTSALEVLYAEIGAGRVQRGGLDVITSVNLDLQEQASCARAIQLARLGGTLPLDTLGSQNCPSGALLPRLSQGDILNNQSLDASVVVSDPLSGEVLAIAGDAQVTHQAGTILSPFIYLTGFTRGMEPASLVWDVPGSIPPELEGFSNFDGTFHGPMRIRTASAYDYLVPLLSTLQQVGAGNAWNTSYQSGLVSLATYAQLNDYAPLVDEGRVSLMEITQAYSMLANSGTLAGADPGSRRAINGPDTVVVPILIRQINDRLGLQWNLQVPSSKPVTTAQLAYLVTHMLSDETLRRKSLGHPNDFDIARPVAGKQGRGLTESSVWTLGYTPETIVGVWAGIEPEDMPSGERSLSVSAASGLWHAIMKTASQGKEIQDWVEPIGIVHQVVCDPSGMLPTKECPNTANEVFITGSEPLQADHLYQSFVINTQTNRLATISTPPEFVEERVYLVVPPEAQTWAEQEGLPLPPDTYDVVFNPGPPSETASITSPEVFSYVSGIVEVRGSASGENFELYRVRIGEGLNPRQWLQIGEGSNRPVKNGLLTRWDTTGLNGLYALQVQVVAENQSIETASIQVTVDNQPPVIQPLHPLEGEILQFPDQKEQTFQVTVSDNLGLVRVEFWIDGSLHSMISDPPYTIPWSGTIGQHQLEIRALDVAGNIAIIVINFKMEE
ncbi:MAG: transglycosylase domain-containing protein [Anaerolineales bacterium]|nr:transglycosylase domain-containing protein [Anaerolineales bacterium]